MLCVDEKSQIQAVDRTQPGLPLKKGPVATMTATDAETRRRLRSLGLFKPLAAYLLVGLR